MPKTCPDSDLSDPCQPKPFFSIPYTLRNSAKHRQVLSLLQSRQWFSALTLFSNPEPWTLLVRDCKGGEIGSQPTHPNPKFHLSNPKKPSQILFSRHGGHAELMTLSQLHHLNPISNSTNPIYLSHQCTLFLARRCGVGIGGQPDYFPDHCSGTLGQVARPGHGTP